MASSTSARNRRSWVLSARPSPAIFHSARSASARVAYRSGEVRMTPCAGEPEPVAVRGGADVAHWPHADPFGQFEDLATVRTGRSAACSSPAPLMRHGLRGNSPSSSTAVVMIARSSRYAFAAIDTDTPLARSLARHSRTSAADILPTGTPPM